VQKVAKSPTAAYLLVEIAAASFAKIRDRTEFHFHLSPVVESAVHSLHGIACIFLVEKFTVDVTDHMITEVVADVKFVDPTKLGKFKKHVLVKTKKVFEGLHFVYFGFRCAAIVVDVAVCLRIAHRSLLELGYAHRMPVDVFDEDRR